MIDGLFGSCYGLDWLATGLGFAGAGLLWRKISIGFLVMALAAVFAMAVAMIARQYGFIPAGVLGLFIALRHHRRWILEDRAEAFTFPLVSDR